MTQQRNIKQVVPPDLTDVLENLAQQIFKTMNCVQVGEIQSFDTSDQTATVQISIKKVIDIDTDGTKRLQNYPVLLKCPVMVLTGGGSHITMPIQSGDPCIILFNDRDIDNWFFDGGLREPNTFRRHDLSDAMAIVGVRNLQQSISGYLSDGIELLYDGTNKMQLKSGTIESTTPIFRQNGNMTVTGGLAIGGTVTQLAGATPLTVDANITQTPGRVLKAGNGATGTFTSNDGKTITVQDGIVTNIT